MPKVNKIMIVNSIKEKINDLIEVCRIFTFDRLNVNKKLDSAYLETIADFIGTLREDVVIRLEDAIKFINLFFSNFNTISFINHAVNTIESISYDYINYEGTLPKKDNGNWLKDKINPMLEAILPETIYVIMSKLLNILDPVWMSLEYLTYNLWIKNKQYINEVVSKLESYRNKYKILDDLCNIEL